MRCFTALVCLLGVFLPCAFGTTYFVTPDGAGDYPTIQAAIAAAADGDTVLLADGTFTGSGNRGIDFQGKGIVVASQSGDPDSCIIDCESAARGFEFHSGEGHSSVLNAVGVTRGIGGDGWGGGGVLCVQGASPQIVNCAFWNNLASSYGGAIACVSGSTAYVSNCRFWQNSAYEGGAMLSYESSPAVVGCTFAANSAQFGGALLISYDNGPDVASFSDCVFDSNIGAQGPGAMYLWYCRPLFTNCSIVRSAFEGIRCRGDSAVLQNTIIAFGQGPGVVVDGSPTPPAMTCCDVFGNSGGDWTECIADQYGVNGNISLDPLFCDLDVGDVHLRDDSPCAPYAPPNEECDLVGALGVSCQGPPDPGYLWVPAYGDDVVNKVDAETHEIVATIGVGDGPAGVAVGSTYVFVTHRATSRLYRIGKTTDAVVDSIDLSSVMAFGIGVAVDTMGYAYVVGRSSMSASGTDHARLVKIDPTGDLIDWAELPDIQGDDGPASMWRIGIGLNRTGAGYIPWQRSWTVSTGVRVFDTTDLSMVDHVFSPHPTGYRGPGVGIDSLGNGWTTGSSSSGRSISKVSPTAGIEHHPVDCAGLAGVAVDPEGGIWGGYGEASQLLHFTEGPPAEWQCLPAPSAHAGMAIDGAGYLWVAFPDLDEVRKYDLEGNQVGLAVPVGDYPLGFGDMTGYECTFQSSAPPVESEPQLTWAEMPGYGGQNGLDPNSGNAVVPIEYRVVYSSEDNLPPLPGYPQVVIEANGDTLSDPVPGEGTFGMITLEADTTYSDGRTYYYRTSLPFLPNHDYQYRFAAKDDLGQDAVGEPTAWHDGPEPNYLDLAIYADDILFDPPHPELGEAFIIEARVHNESNVDLQNVWVSFYDEEADTLIDRRLIPEAPAGVWTPVVLTYAYHEPGFYPIRVRVDEDDLHAEWNELNNNAVRGIIAGEYTLPAWIAIDGALTDRICAYGSGRLTGYATYVGLPIPEMPVRGARVTLTIEETSWQFTGRTNDDGYFSVPFSVGSLPAWDGYGASVEITDFTVTGEATYAFDVIQCGESGGDGDGGGWYVVPGGSGIGLNLSYDSDCLLVGEQRPLSGSVVNGTASTVYDLTVWIFVDGALLFRYDIASLGAGELLELPGIPAVGFSNVGGHLIQGQLDPYGAGPSIPVYAWPNQPDALPSAIYFSDGAPLVDQEIGITGLVRNLGGVPFGGDSLGVAFYDSLEEVLELSEIWYGKVPVPPPCGGSTVAAFNDAFSPAGDHIVRLFADPDSEYVEWNEDNNVLDRVLPVRDPRPDFLVTYEGLLAVDPLASPGDSVSFLAEVWNFGETSYEDTVWVRFMMNDSTLLPVSFLPEGIPLDSVRVCASAALWTGDWTVDPDSHLVQVKVDPANEIVEIHEFNNSADCRVPVDFEIRPIDACEMFQDTMDPDCDRILEWDEVEIHARVWNLGCFSAGDSIEVRFYDIFGFPEPDTTYIASAWVDSLGDHKHERDVHILHQFIARGLHEVLVWVDEDSTWDGSARWAEYTRQNNSLSAQVRVGGEYPDITLNSEHINPSQLTPGVGDSVIIAATVFNIGLAVADTFAVSFRVDSDSLGDPPRVPFLGYNPDGHPPNYTTLQIDSVWVITEADCGPHALWVVTDCDSALAEMDEDNNEATRVILVCEDVPDLYVLDREFSATPIGEFQVGVDPAAGHSFWLEAVVHNAGGRAGTATATFECKVVGEGWEFIGNEPVYVAAQSQDSVGVLWTAPAEKCKLRVTISGTQPPELNYANNSTMVDFRFGEVMGTPDAELPRLAMLHSNAPNPFRPSTTIRFDLPDTRRVTLKVYDAQGRLVRTLLDAPLAGGQYALRWDGRSDARYRVGAGVYFCRMVAGDYERTLKMVLIK